MGAMKNLLIELEDQGVVRWSDSSHTYVSTKDGKPFKLNEYLKHHKNALNNKLGKEDECNKS